MDRILNMIIRRFVGQLVNRGIRTGVERVARASAGDDTPEQQARARRTADQAQQAIRLARRVGRF